MKLDRNVNADGRGKYALVRLRTVEPDGKIWWMLKGLEMFGVLDWGDRGKPDEFFIIRLKDEYAQHALRAYAAAAMTDDPEYANEVYELASRSGPASPFCKKPD